MRNLTQATELEATGIIVTAPGRDADIVSRLARGDVGALQELMDRHWSQLVAYAGRMVPAAVVSMGKKRAVRLAAMRAPL